MQQRDLVILSHLRKDCRMGLTKMSRSSRVPVSTIHDRINALNGTLIHRNTALLNFASLGYNTRVNILLRVNPKDKEALRSNLLKSMSVNSLYKINNGFDYQAECIFRTMAELEEFIDKLEQQHSIKGKEVYFIIDDVKREGFLAEPELVQIYNQK